MSKLVLRESAFIPLVTSCIEIYRKECFGILLGSKRGSTYNVNYCLPYLSAKRGYRTITMAKSRQKMINNVLNCLSKHEVIGDFHSHPGDVIEYLSGTDVEDLFVMKKDFISLLVNLKKTKEYQKWKLVDKIAIQGTVGKFVIDIKAFYYDHEKKSIARMEIDCPYIKKMNKLFCKINKREIRKKKPFPGSKTKPPKKPKKPKEEKKKKQRKKKKK